MSDPVFHCVVDSRPIPHTRALRRSTTCCDECATALVRMRRQMIDTRKCRLCGVPSTPEERQLFVQWRRKTGQTKPRGRQKKQAAEVAE